MGLAVGVTGHRTQRLGAVDLEALAAGIGSVMQAIQVACRAQGTAVSRLVSNVADGADSIIAGCGAEIGWPLEAVLPFPRTEYARDFPEGLSDLGRQLAAAARVLELPGDRENDGDAAYERAGHIMLAQSDLVIAVWDGKPAWGRGGTAQIVAEAVDQSIPVIHIDPAAPSAPMVIWDGLVEEDLGGETLETAAREDLSRLSQVIASMAGNGVSDALLDPARAPRIAIVCRFALAIVGTRRMAKPPLEPCASASASDPTFCLARRIDELIDPGFATAERNSAQAAALFRGTYVTNYVFAALAVLLSLLGLILPPGFKPFLAALEFLIIGTILALTRAGHQGGWQQRWLESRHFAERLRCMRLSARLGDPGLRVESDHVGSPADLQSRAVGRRLGVPNVAIDHAYLAAVQADLLRAIREQIAYATSERKRMHRLDHSLHLTGLALFGATAVTCSALLGFEIFAHAMPGPVIERISHGVVLGATIFSAALPAIGAAIYAIRMQGDFAGIARRTAVLDGHLTALAEAVSREPANFDTLRRRIDRLTDLLLTDVSSWRQAYQARPLSLPG